MVENSEDYLATDDIVDIVCSECGIPSFRHNMVDEEIAQVCKYIGENAPGVIVIHGKKLITMEGFDTMIFITITEFPRFFEEHMLYMVWRN